MSKCMYVFQSVFTNWQRTSTFVLPLIDAFFCFCTVQTDITRNSLQVVAFYHGLNMSYKPVSGKAIHWPGGRRGPPPDTPRCGFLGTDPMCQGGTSNTVYNPYRHTTPPSPPSPQTPSCRLRRTDSMFQAKMYSTFLFPGQPILFIAKFGFIHSNLAELLWYFWFIIAILLCEGYCVFTFGLNAYNSVNKSSS